MTFTTQSGKEYAVGERVRATSAANPDDYMEFYIYEDPATHEKSAGPWVKLWSPVNEIVGNKNPHMMLILELGDLNDPCWRPLPKSLERAQK